jgi:hypothetical protein
VDWIHLPQVRDQPKAVVKTVTNPYVPKKRENFLDI